MRTFPTTGTLWGHLSLVDDENILQETLSHFNGTFYSRFVDATDDRINLRYKMANQLLVDRDNRHRYTD